VTYVVADNPENTFRWHLASGGSDHVIGTAPLWCACGEYFEGSSFGTGFSTDGNFVWLVETLVNSTDLQVRRLDGSLVGAEIRGDNSYASPPTMGVWSGADLFFRDKAGVERGSEGAIKPFLPGVAWVHPKASPNAGQIVYAARGSDGFSHISLVDVTSGRARQLSSQPRISPFFLSPRYVWYKGERPCVPGDPCVGTITTTPTGKTYIYDLQTGIEAESIITDIADTWPHGA